LLVLCLLALFAFGLYKLIGVEEPSSFSESKIKDSAQEQISTLAGEKMPSVAEPPPVEKRNTDAKSIVSEPTQQASIRDSKSYILPKYEYEKVSVNSDTPYSSERLDNLTRAVQQHQLSLLPPEDQPLEEKSAAATARAQEAVRIHQELNSQTGQQSAVASPARQKRLSDAVNLHQNSQKPAWEQTPVDAKKSSRTRQQVINEAVGLHQSSRPSGAQGEASYSTTSPAAATSNANRQKVIQEAVQLHQSTMKKPDTNQ